MIDLIIAKTDAETSAPFVMSGEGKIICDTLSEGESVTLLEERPGGEYKPVPNANGLGVVLSPGQESYIFVGYGNYKAVKTATSTDVGVGIEQ